MRSEPGHVCDLFVQVGLPSRNPWHTWHSKCSTFLSCPLNAFILTDYSYYEHLAPLSPIVIPDFSQPSTHRTLLTDEPVLAVTILTTASRHMKPKGDGAYTRSFYIHDRLWSYLRGMIERLFWGQEKFGGNGIGISKPRSFDLAPSAAKVSLKGNLRSLGSIEALLILTDWHPRNLHFPPGDDENTLLDLDAHAQARLEKDVEHDGEPTHHRSSQTSGEGSSPSRSGWSLLGGLIECPGCC